MHSRFLEKSITVLILCIVYIIHIMYCLHNTATSSSSSRDGLANPKNGAQLLLILNEHNCFITLIFLKHFSTPRKD